MEIDYGKLIRPQLDGYDINFFKQVKQENGFIKKDFPYLKKSFDNKMYLHTWRQQETLPAKIINDFAVVDAIALETKKAAPLEYNMLVELVDVFTPILCANGHEYSCQHAAHEYPNAWIVMASVNNDPVVTIRNMCHELIHWKFTALGFGSGITPENMDMIEHNYEFVLNPYEELHHSIVNSYNDTAQASVGHKASGRPISASIHAYASFLIEIDVALKFIQYNPQKYYIWFSYIKKWGNRLDESLEALLRGAKTTPKGAQLLLGLYNWTRDFQQDYKDSLVALSKLI